MMPTCDALLQIILVDANGVDPDEVVRTVALEICNIVKQGARSVGVVFVEKADDIRPTSPLSKATWSASVVVGNGRLGAAF
jgi:hypothetical protein